MSHCTCNGMNFICNRWVFTGECRCPVPRIPTRIEQCEGCAYPLAHYMEEWERGDVEVTWKLCGEHAHQVQTSMHSEY